MAARSFPLAVDQAYEVQLGRSFSKSAPVSYHSLSYDFKPASVSDKKLGLLEVGRNKEVTITIPNSQHDSTTTFRGSAKEAMKECVLIIEPDGTITLEKISSKVQVKQSRTKEPVLSSPVLADAPSSVATANMPVLPEPRAITPTPSLATGAQKSRALEPVQFVPAQPEPLQEVGSMSSDSETSSDSSSSDTESSSGSSGSSSSDDDETCTHALRLEQMMEPNTSSAPAHTALALKSQPSPGLQEDLLMSSDSDTI